MPQHILVVDDEADVRTLLEIMLTQEGWQVTTAVDGETGSAAYAEQPYDLIVLDNMMPGLSGIEVAHELRRKGSSVPIVLFSGFLDPDLKRKAEALNLWPCSKVDLKALVSIIRNILDAGDEGSQSSSERN